MHSKYCQKCKEKLAGKYCSNCGTKADNEPSSNEIKHLRNWQDEKDIGLIISNPEIQEFIKSYTDRTKKPISAEEFLKRFDFLFSPLTGLSLKTLMDITVPIYKKIGIKTGKSKSALLNYPIQVVLVKLLCSLIKNNYPLKEVQEAKNGIVLIAEIPSCMKTFGGEIIILLDNQIPNTKVSVDARIKGQLYDWGKSKSIIKTLISDIEEIEITH